MDPYKLLGVEQDCDDTGLKKRYKHVSRMFHPDKHNQDPTSIAVFQMIKNAYDNIKNIREHKTHIIPKIEPPKSDQRQIRDTSTHNKKENEKIANEQIRTIAEPLRDPWFHPDFELTDFFGDVTIPKKKKKNDEL